MGSKYERQNRYDAGNTRKFGMKLNRKTDAAIIDKLESVDSIQGYVKELIRRDLKLPLYLRIIEKKILDGYEMLDMETKHDGQRSLLCTNMIKKGPVAGEPDRISVLGSPGDTGAVRVKNGDAVTEEYIP